MAKSNPHGLAYDRYLSPPDDDDPPECEPCGGMGRQWDPLSYGYFDCPTCGGSGYRNTEPDADVGLDWMP
jgi:hypothetical protein